MCRHRSIRLQVAAFARVVQSLLTNVLASIQSYAKFHRATASRVSAYPDGMKPVWRKNRSKMKRCPTCNLEYDDTLRFCLKDGETLVRSDQPAGLTMTMPAQREFQPPAAPSLQIPVQPSLSTTRSLSNIFFAPARVFASFGELTTFAPAAIRFLIAAAIIIIAVVSYNIVYLARIGSETIGRATIEASPRVSALPEEQKERALLMQQNPAIKGFALLMRFGTLILLQLVSLPLGALLYWLGAMLCKGAVRYMQALLVWTYATLPATALWALGNIFAVLVLPPTTNIGIATGTNGVVHANLGALFDVTTFPIPVHVVALSAIDLFEFYGLALAIFGLRKVTRITWIGSFVIVIFVWLIGVGWRVSTAGIFAALMN